MVHHEKYDVTLLGVFLNALNLVLQGRHGEEEEGDEGGIVVVGGREGGTID